MKNIHYPILAGLLAACGGAEQSAPKGTIDTVAIASHIETLASDDFLGRKPFTEGETKTLEYLESAFASYGLEPGNGLSYFQEVPMVELDAQPSDQMIIGSPTDDFALQLGDEFVAYTERVEEEVSLEDSELVFAGYGVVAPEYGWDDYAGLDVKGKTVVVLVNDPGFGSGDSTLFKGETMTYYGRWTYKYEEAARQGAAGVLIIHDTAPAGYPWLVVRNSWSGASLYLDQTGDAYKPIVQGWITREAAIRIFEASDVDMKNFVEKARSTEFEPVPLGVTASVSVRNGIKRDKSQNVIAKITGSTNPEEYVLYSAHWDHLGVGAPVDGDSIYNGAHDNASGTAALLAIAKAMAEREEQPKRSVVFLAVTAEEQGLLGSKYYAENPIYLPSETVANINMDGIKNYGPMKDLTVVGYGQSELEEIAEEIAKTQGRYIMPDPEPSKGYFFRSDHFQFAKVGIPALFASGAYEHMDPAKGVAYLKEKNDEYNQNRYHRPADEYDAATWEFGGVYQDVDLFYQLGWKLANGDLWPAWKQGSEFKAIREAM
ncbi:M28 family metallopeptidase [Marinoscillum furvescens]|uniref:Zn-dependent M28 family amino/carboxypeptidase n=1 Tax=Marinoscillum furvescens DSM 4134 TaxID=1122208 RepID=A0A3D9KZ81_MARFU|nr:M28 family metallopeptidase [Marinoscillum furvescens]RED93409.1 Zn-dependent M28 family amino/carboxypeptidase [Marinoscillum furvescens DSM 4134]